MNRVPKPKEVKGRFTVEVVEQKNNQDHISYKCQYDEQLIQRDFLDLMSVFHITDLTGTMLGFLLVDEGIDFASKANSKS